MSTAANITAVARAKPGYYIAFRLGDETFAMHVSQVREVLDLALITRVPDGPSYLRGLVSVREQAIPLVDLRRRFGFDSEVAISPSARILVLELSIAGRIWVLAGLAESVHDVIEFRDAQIEPPPAHARRWPQELISGMARREEEFVLLVDAAALFDLRELTGWAAAGGGPV